MPRFFRKIFRQYNHHHISEKKRKVIDDWYDLQVRITDHVPHEEEAVRAIWSSVSADISGKGKGFSSKRFLVRWVAALLLVSGAGAIFYYYQFSNRNVLDTASIQPAAHQALVRMEGETDEEEVDNQYDLHALTGSHAKANVILTTPKGSSFNVTLPDGTRVFLNSDSKLSYPKAFTDSIRKVYVQGEAYFEVAHHESLPFIVQTEELSIRVLGTKFNVRAYPESAENIISLLEGSVRLSTMHAETLMLPGELVHVEHAQSAFEKQQLGNYDPIAWKNGIFNFSNTTVSEISRELSRWYNVEFDLSDLQQELRFTAKISRHIPLDDVLRHLSSTHELQFEVIKDKIKITSLSN